MSLPSSSTMGTPEMRNLRHECVRVAQRVAGVEVERICNNAVFAALDKIDLLGLMLNAHILMNDADAAFAGWLSPFCIP